jgi:hypothetical protein
MRKSRIKTRLNCSLAIKLSDEQRAAVEKLASIKEISLGEATRRLLEKGIETMGMQL